MNETTEVVVTTEKQQIIDQLVVAVLSGIASVLTTKLVDKSYRSAVANYRLNRKTA